MEEKIQENTAIPPKEVDKNNTKKQNKLQAQIKREKAMQENWKGPQIYEVKAPAIQYISKAKQKYYKYKSSLKNKKTNSKQQQEDQFQISLDNCPQSQIEIRKFAKIMHQNKRNYNQNQQPNGSPQNKKKNSQLHTQPSLDKKASVKDLALGSYQIEEGRYLVYSSTTQNSSQNEISPKFQDVDEIAQQYNGQPTKKTIYFVLKIQNKNTQGKLSLQNCQIKFVKVKGYQKRIPTVNLIAIRDTALFCSIETISTITKFKFILCEKTNPNNILMASKEISFGGNNFILELNDFSYSFTKQKRLNINILQELIIYILLAPQELKAQVFRLAVKNAQKIIKDKKINIDTQILSLLESESMTDKKDYLLMLAKIMGQTKIGDNQPRRTTLQTLFYLFMGQIEENFQPSCQSPEDYQVLNKIFYFVTSDPTGSQNCLANIAQKKIKQTGMKRPDQIMLNLIHKCLQVLFKNHNQGDYLRQILEFCIDKRVSFLSQIYGFSTLMEKFQQVSNSTSGQYILSVLMVLCYYSDRQPQKKLNMFNEFLKYFKNQNFSQDPKQYQKQKNLDGILKYTQIIYYDPTFEISTIKNYFEFNDLYQKFKKHPILFQMMEIENLIQKIKKFAQNVKNNPRQQKYIEVIKSLYITQYDQKIISLQSRKKLEQLMQTYIHNFQKSSYLYEVISQIFYQLLKEKQYQIAENITYSLNQALIKKSPIQALKGIDKNFSQLVISETQSLRIFKDLFFNYLITTYYPLKNIKEILRENNWHNRFTYKKQINQMILQHMIRCIQKGIPQITQQQAQRKKIKKQLTDQLPQGQMRENLQSIIFMDTIQITEKNVEQILWKSPAKLNILLRIKNKDDRQNADRAEALNVVLFEIGENILNKNIELNKVIYLNNLSKYYKTTIKMLFSNDKIFNILQNYRKQAQSYLNLLKMYQRFFIDLHNSYQTQEPLDLINKFKSAQQSIHLQSIKNQDISIYVDSLKAFNIKILQCYTFKPFFGGQLGQKRLKNAKLDQIIDISNRCFSILKETITKTQQKYRNCTLCFQDMSYFLKGKTLKPKELQKIFSWEFQNPQTYLPIIQIYQIMWQIKKISLSVASVLQLMKSFNENSNQVTEYYNICKKIQKHEKNCDLSSLKSIKDRYETFLIQKKKIPLKMSLKNQAPIRDPKFRNKYLKKIQNPVDDIGQIILQVIQESYNYQTFLNKPKTAINNKNSPSKQEYKSLYQQIIFLGKSIEEIKQFIDQQEEVSQNITFQQLQGFQDVIEYIQTVRFFEKSNSLASSSNNAYKFSDFIRKLKNFLKLKPNLPQKMKSVRAIIDTVRQLKTKLTDGASGSKKFIQKMNNGIIFRIRKYPDGRNIYDFIQGNFQQQIKQRERVNLQRDGLMSVIPQEQLEYQRQSRYGLMRMQESNYMSRMSSQEDDGPRFTENMDNQSYINGHDIKRKSTQRDSFKKDKSSKEIRKEIHLDQFFKAKDKSIIILADLENKINSLTLIIHAAQNAALKGSQNNQPNLQQKNMKLIELLQAKNNIQRFLQIQKIINQIISTQNLLTSWGQMIFSNFQRQLFILKGDQYPLKQFLKQRSDKLNNYQDRIEQIYNEYYKGAMLQGSQLKAFYEFLVSDKTFHPSFGEIASQQQFKIFKKSQKKSLEYLVGKQYDFQCLNLIKRFFTKLKEIQQPKHYQRPQDYKQNKVHLVTFPADDSDFSRGLTQIGQIRLKKLKREHLLLCSSETTIQELRSFIERALRDNDNQYVILDAKQLQARKQQFLINRINQYRNKNNQMRLKICLVGDSQLQMIFQFMKKLKVKQNKEGIQTLADGKQIFFDFLKEKSQGVKIYKSKEAGMGKTYQIEKVCKIKNYKPVYFPISGRITQKILYQRIFEITEQIKQNEKIALIIQLYNISQISRKIVNNFLLSIIFFRSISYASGSLLLNKQLNEKTPIFIELQNITKFDHMSNQNLPFLNLLEKLNAEIGNAKERVIINFNQYQQLVQNTEIDMTNFQVNYLMKHLQCYDQNKIDILEIKPFQEFVKEKHLFVISQQRVKTLVKNYFWQPMIKEQQNPNFYQYQYWLKLLIGACKNFSNCYPLKISSINENFDKIFIQILSLKTLRQEFLKVIIQNARAFIKRTVSMDQFQKKQGQDQLMKAKKNIMSDQLQKFPFFIIPDVQGQGFAFIYKDHKKIPISIKKFIMSQTYQLHPQVYKLATIMKSKDQNAIRQSIDRIFEPQSLSFLEKKNDQQKQLKKQKGNQLFSQKLSNILNNISGNKSYNINCQNGYVVNLDNFFKMCLTVERSRQNIPIVIMGQAGVGKTALLRHTVIKLFQHEFQVLNINAGVDYYQIKSMLKVIQQKATRIQKERQEALKVLQDQSPQNKKILDQISVQQMRRLRRNATKKLWVFFDQFNTSDELGYIKQLMMEKRFMGKTKKIYQNIVAVAACNPYRQKAINNQKNKENQKGFIGLARNKNSGNNTNNKKQDLAFKVNPPPTSMIACMWNYGELGLSQTQKYIHKMLSSIKYGKIQLGIKAILKTHDFIKQWIQISAVSLRDIQRFRTFYHWFLKNLPKQSNINRQTYLQFKEYEYKNRQERAFIMAFTFCYLLRFPSNKQRHIILRKVEQIIGFPKVVSNNLVSKINPDYNQNSYYMLKVKEFEQNDFYSRLVIDTPGIAANNALKQNIYTCFVSIYTKMPMIIVGSPGCSKSLSIRILVDNIKLKRNQNDYLKQFSNVRVLPFQGSQTCESVNVQKIFDRADKFLSQQKQKIKEQNLRLTPLIVFDQIGLAQESPDNPLKVLHPYLQVNRQNDQKIEKEKKEEKNKNVKKQQSGRKIAFIGISNWQLDLSKMSRFLIISRPQLQKKDLIQTAISISSKFTQDQVQSKSIVQRLSNSYFTFIQQWKQDRLNDYKNFFGLRDFYSLIKCFWEIVEKNGIGLANLIQVQKGIQRAIFKNFNGRSESFNKFMQIYHLKKIQRRQKQHNQQQNFKNNQKMQEKPQFQKIKLENYNIKKFDIIEILLQCLKSKNSRCPLVIVPDNSSVSFLKYKIQNSLNLKKTDYQNLNANLNFNNLNQRDIMIEKGQREYQEQPPIHLLQIPSSNNNNIIVTQPYHQQIKVIYDQGSHFQKDQHNKSYIYNSLAHILTCVSQGQVVIMNKINPTVQTALYDLFNKFYSTRGGNNICKVTFTASSGATISDQNLIGNRMGNNTPGNPSTPTDGSPNSASGLLSSSVIVHPNFNALVIVHEKDLKHIQAPFLNRFQKYQFDLAEYSLENTEGILKKFKNLQKKIGEVVGYANVNAYRGKQIEENNVSKLKHLPYEKRHLFINWSTSAIKTLIMKQIIRKSSFLNNQRQRQRQKVSIQDQKNPFINEEQSQIFTKVIQKAMMNSTQDFYFVYKAIIQNNQDFSKQWKIIINQTLKQKFDYEPKHNSQNAIVFTTDMSLTCKQLSKNVMEEDAVGINNGGLLSIPIPVNGNNLSLQRQPMIIKTNDNIVKQKGDVLQIQLTTLKTQKDLLNQIESAYTNSMYLYKSYNIGLDGIKRSINEQANMMRNQNQNQYLQPQNDQKKTSINYKQIHFKLSAKHDSLKVDYLDSLIKKVEKKHRNIRKKKVYMIFNVDRTDQKEAKMQKKEDQQISISFLNDYQQLVYQGNCNQLLKQQDFFSNISMKTLLRRVSETLDFTFENQAQLNKIMQKFQNFKNQIFNDETVLGQITKKVIKKLQTRNLKFSEQDISNVLANQQLFKNYRNIRQALTTYASQNKFDGLVSMFIKYLCERQALLTFNLSSSLPLMEEQISAQGIKQLKELVQSNNINMTFNNKNALLVSQSNPNYQKNSNAMKLIFLQIIQGKMQKIKSDYINAKKMKQLPTPQRKKKATIKRVRLFPFSKAQCQFILKNDQNDKKCLANLAQQYYQHLDQNPQKAKEILDLYKKIFNEKSTFILNSNHKDYQQHTNLYYQIDREPEVWRCLFLDLLIDFLQQNNMKIKYLMQFQKLLNGFLISKRFSSFQDKVLLLLGYKKLWISVFKFYQVFYDNGAIFPKTFYERFTYKDGSKNDVRNNIDSFVNQFIIKFSNQRLLPKKQNIQFFKGEKNYYKIFKNAILQLQNLQKCKTLSSSNKILKELQVAFVYRNFFTFIQSLSSQEQKNIQTLQDFVKYSDQIQNCFQSIFNYLSNSLKYKQQKRLEQEKANFEKQKQASMTYLANQLFAEWFKSQIQHPLLLKNFLLLCDQDSNFSHNSVNTLNYFLSLNEEINFEHPQKFEECLDQFKQFVPLLQKIGEHCKANQYKNNLSILFVNVFYHHLSSKMKIKQIKLNQKQNKNSQNYSNILIQQFYLFEQFSQKIKTNKSKHSLVPLFFFAFIKIYLEKYILALQDRANFQHQVMKKIDMILANDDAAFTKSCRFYCLKLLRRIRPTKQIHTNYIKNKIVYWTLKMSKELEEHQSRSFTVPKYQKQSLLLRNKLKQFQESQGGKVQLLKQIFEEGGNSYQNKYCLLNFFMKFIFSKSYTQIYYQKIRKTFDEEIKPMLLASQFYLKQEVQLFSRYIDSKVTQNLKVVNQQNLNEDLFIILNNINWLFAVSTKVSPLTSLFFNYKQEQLNGKIQQVLDPNHIQKGTFFQRLTNEMFVLSGVQNPFIKNANFMIQMTRNDQIGIYICGNQCDYLYMHGDCGWPSQVSQCPYCKQQIGSTGRSHVLAGVQRGAKRVTSKKVVDNSNFYCWNMTKIDLYWQGQRFFVKSQINRMNSKNIILIDKQPIKMTGYKVQKTDRTSQVTFKFIKFVLSTQLYMLITLGILDINNQKQKQKINDPMNCQYLYRVFGKKNQNQILQTLQNSIFDQLQSIKNILDLKNKFNGWMYGITQKFYQISYNFSAQIKLHQQRVRAQQVYLGQKFKAEGDPSNKALKDVYKPVYLDMSDQLLNNSLVSKQVMKITKSDARNAFNRDLYQILINTYIAQNSFDKKFDFALNNQTNQGKLQFPFQTFLMQDDIKQNQYPFAKIFKLPQAPISLFKVQTQYEMVIKQSYPYLQYLMMNYAVLEQIEDYYNVIGFINKLMKEVQNKKTRQQSCKMTLKELLDEIYSSKVQSTPQQLKNPQKIIKSWVRLAKSLGTLQNGCKIIGKMNDQYNLSTEFRAFILDNSSKENVLGLMIGSLFHNFAKSYNQILSILNSRKNKIHQYKNLSLINTSIKMHPQNILSKSDLVVITEKDLIQKLTDSSINSIIYGRNVYFHNFNMMQNYFVKKLNGKCQLISDLEQMRSICYNGQAFSQKAQDSNAIAQVRQIGQKLNWGQMPTQIKKQTYQYLQSLKKKCRSSQQYTKSLIQIRGHLEKILVLIKNKEGNTKVRSFSQFIRTYKLQIDHHAFIQNPLNEMDVIYIVNLYEIIQEALKDYTLSKVPEKYSQKLQSKEIYQQIKRQLKQLSLGNYLNNKQQNMMNEQNNNEFVSLIDLKNGLIKFISRNLTTATFDEQGTLLQFLPARQDFWPYNYDSDKVTNLGYVCNPAFLEIKAKNALQFLEMVQQAINQKVK